MKNTVNLRISLYVLIGAVIMILLAPVPSATAEGSDWALMEGGTSQTLIDVWGTSATDVFTVGVGGLIVHYDGSSWTTMSSGTDNSLWGIWGSSGTDVFAVGFSGTILHYDGSNWADMSPNTDDSFRSVWGSASNDVFAVTSDGTIYHYNGNHWAKMNSPVPGYHFSDIWGSASDDVYVTCLNGKVYHYDGSTWAQEFSCPQMLRGIWGSGPNDIIVVGRADQIYRYDGNNWDKMANAASGYTSAGCISGRSSTDFYFGSDYGRVYKWDGSNWTAMSSSSSQSIIGLWIDSGSEGFAVSGNGAILHTPVERYEINGSWAVTSIDGSGTFSLTTGSVTSGQVVVGVSVTGDIEGQFSFVNKFYPGEGKWYGTSASISGTVTVDGVDHPGTLWLKGYFDAFNLTGFSMSPPTPPNGWTATLSCPPGETHGWTTDDSNMAADFGWTGSCSGNVSANIINSTWTTSSGNGAGSWDGVSNTCLAGKTEYQGSGGGQVSLPMSPEKVILDYDMSEAGDFILARYDSNPGSMPGTKNILNRFAQVDSSVVSPEFNWGAVELQIEYTDEDIAAATLNEDTLMLHWWDSENTLWEEVPGSWGNPEDNVVWGSLDHFSIYSIQGDPLVIYSCDADGIPKNEFDCDESIYVTGNGLESDTDYNLWLQPPGTMEDDELIMDDDFSETQEVITTDSFGHFDPVEIWDIYNGLDWGQFEFSIVADNLESGVEAFYNADDDELDSVRVNGLVVYVDHTAIGGGDNGSSWDDAFLELSDALLNIPGTPCQIWVASGTYTPGTSRADSFQMINNVEILGGFFTYAGDLEERDWEDSVTVLSGDIGTQGSNSDNSYHVIYNSGVLNNTAVLDGFTITGGYASGTGDHMHGGGMFNETASPQIANCIFTANSTGNGSNGANGVNRGLSEYGGSGESGSNAGNGGAIYNSNSSPTITDCDFSSNSTGGGGIGGNGGWGGLDSGTGGDGGNGGQGGAIYNSNSSPILTDCTISSNSNSNGGGGGDGSPGGNGGNSGHGGAIYNSDSSPTLTNCILLSNSISNGGCGGDGVFDYEGGTGGDSGHGGAIYNSNSSPMLTNCILSFNSVSNGGPGGLGGWGAFFGGIGGDGGNGGHGGAICNNSNSFAELTNCTLSSNSTGTGGNGGWGGDCDYFMFPDCYGGPGGNGGPAGNGGAIYNYNSSPILTNCTLSSSLTGTGGSGGDGHAGYGTGLDGSDGSDGTDGTGGGISNSSSAPIVTNCILWGNNPGEIYPSGLANITYSDIKDGYTGNGNILGNPEFANALGGDFHLKASSPCIDSGSNSAAPLTDFEGDIRPYDGDFDGTAKADMGVDEAETISIMVSLQGTGRPSPAGWQIPLNIGFFNPGSDVMNATPIYSFTGTATARWIDGGTRAFMVIDEVSPETYDITVDSNTTLLNVKRSVPIP